MFSVNGESETNSPVLLFAEILIILHKRLQIQEVSRLTFLSM